MTTELKNKEIIIWGGTGQAKVVRPILEYWGAKLIAVFDDTPQLTPPFDDIPLFEGWKAFPDWLAEHKNKEAIAFCIAIGNPHGESRVTLCDRLQKHGLTPVDVIHPNAIIEKNVSWKPGLQVMAGAVIQTEVQIGRQCIINTSSSVDHECRLGDGVEVAPGATLCGDIKLENYSWVGAGATVLPRITIGENAIVGAGAMVTKDVPPNKTVIGVPARVL